MSDDSQSEKEKEIEIIKESVEYVSSEDPPMDEWSSLDFEIPEENPKRILFEKRLYSPGSGEICTQYIAMSASSVLRHHYYNYPAVVDPGIEVALLHPEQAIIYPDDGQELYLDICKEMNQPPVKLFYRGLVEDTIDLKYYCVNPSGIRAMALALESNRIVKTFNLTDNFLTQDACLHLAQMLDKNSCLYELNLSGCKIGAPGLKKLLSGLSGNKTLKVLNLNKNDLGDSGAQYMAEAVFTGVDIQQIYLSYNRIGSKGAGALAESLETYNNFTVIDLSWNNLFSPVGVFSLLSRLMENKHLTELNLSWNSMGGARLANGIRNVINAPNLRHLDLSNNRFSGEDITTIIADLNKAKKLNYLNISYNPLSIDDALKVLTKIKSVAVKVQHLVLENVTVDENFLKLLEQFKQMKSKKNFVVKYGRVDNIFKPKGPDPREVLLNRAEFLRKKQRKNPGDLTLVAMQLLKDKFEIMEAKDFTTALSMASVPMDSDLADEIINVFAGPRSAKAKTINIRILVDFTQRKWPEKKLPPTPPPEPEPEPVPKKAAKGNKKK
ncbi:leucine-rich repeat-containing protein 74B-like [Amyelois transitella]|uniref:leucine-rich repeat-containing protein 74B-like n=1 Tax=Amyelois transitella TaxID=680683 RepID=UPI00067D52A1|nr:leucine-rich repeat-containing protein 74B-like [Amyelois transitella]